MSWEQIYDFFGITNYIYFISSPELQDYLFPIKLVFVMFAAFFFAAVVYFMVNSSWLKYIFFEDVIEFFAWQSYGARAIAKQWNKIKQRLGTGQEAEYKLAIIEADDFFREVLEDGGYEGETFEEAVKKASRLLEEMTPDIYAAHETRNTIVYDPNFKLSEDDAKRVLDIYEVAINRVGLE